MGWEEEATDNTTSIVHKYYCMGCEDFFILSPLSPLRCPRCFCDARWILGPIPLKYYNLDKMIEKRKKKYGRKLNR